MSVISTPASAPHGLRRRPTLSITAGPIASGKSEWVRSFREPSGGPLCLIRDEARTRARGDAYLQGAIDDDFEEAVTHLMREQAQQALAQGTDVYVDGCQNHPITRNTWESLATRSGADFRLVLFNLPLDEIAALNARREVPHPKDRVEASFRRWEEQFKSMPRRPQNLFMAG